MAILIPDARQLSDETLEALRLRALRARDLGLPEITIADVLGVAERGLTGNDHPGRGYARVGQTPELPVSGDKARVNLLSTVTNDGELHFQVYTAMMNATLFLSFLERLVAGAARKVFLI